MADDDHGGVRLVQHTLQPMDGVDVQVVGRFVEQQHVGVRKQRLRQQHAQLEAGRNFAHGAVVQFGANASVRQDAGRTAFGVVAAVLGKLPFQFRGAHVVVVGGIRIGVEAVTLGHGGPHLAVALHDCVDDALVLVAELVLAQLTQPHACLQHDFTRALLQIAAQDLHEGGFAAAVGANEAITVAVGELHRHALEQGLGAKLDGDIGGGKHGSLGWSSPPLYRGLCHDAAGSYNRRGDTRVASKNTSRNLR